MEEPIKFKPETKNLSGQFEITVKILGIIVMALVIFAVGVWVGFEKARFSLKWGENYEKNFAGPPPPEHPEKFLKRAEGRDFRNAHGLSGTIISITDNKLVIKDLDEKENTVMVVEKTVIKYGRENYQLNQLKNGDKVVVLGRPDKDGVIEAELIRIFPGN